MQVVFCLIITIEKSSFFRKANILAAEIVSNSQQK